MVPSVRAIYTERYFTLTYQDEIDTPSGSDTSVRAQLRRQLDGLYPQIFRMVSAMTYGSGLDADDITQDVFLKAWQKSDSFKQGSLLTTWVYSIARNTVIDASRKQKIRKMVSVFRSGGDSGNAYETEFPDTTPDVVENRELRNLLRKTIAELPEMYKSIIIFREVQDLSYEQISAITGDNEGTLKSRLFHAKARLRTELEKKGYRYENL